MTSPDHVPPHWWRAMRDGIDADTAATHLDDEHAETASAEELRERQLDQDLANYEATQPIYADTNLEQRRQKLLQSSPQLRDLAQWANEERALTERIRLAVCLLREWPNDPVSLGDLALVTGRSRSGIRTLYQPDSRAQLTSLLGATPATPRDTESPAARIDLTTPPPSHLLLGSTVEGTPVYLPQGASCLVDIALDDPRRHELWDLIAAQVLHSLLTTADLAVPSDIFDLAAPTSLTKLITNHFPRVKRNYQPSTERANTHLLQVRSIASLHAQPSPPPDETPLLLFGHVRTLSAVMPGAYQVTPPLRRWQQHWTMTSPTGAVTEFLPAQASVENVISTFTEAHRIQAIDPDYLAYAIHLIGSANNPWST